jgi:2-methylcitrate dehydratase
MPDPPERAPNQPLEPGKCQQLARWATTRRFEDLPSDGLDYLKLLVLDTLGCAIGALRGGPIGAIRGVEQEAGGNPQCTLIGGGRTGADRATFFNGALVRYLDFMDIYMVPGQTCHPSDNLAAVLAATELAAGTGRDFLTALAVAYQVQGRFSEMAPLQEKGFDHVTHLAFSVPAAVSRALGLGHREAANAIALCGASLTTLWVVRTGLLSHWKGFASAQAAMAAVHITLLAARGITGPLNLMEGPQGWEETVGDRVDIAWEKEPLDRFRKSSVKRYNAEAHTQSILEGLLELREEERIVPEEVLRVEVDTFKQAHNIVGGGEAGDRATVLNKEQADHSLAYLCAVALIDGDVYPEQFAGERVTKPDVQELMKRVWTRQREALSARYPKEMPMRISVLLRDGRELVREKNDYLGFWRTRPLDWQGALAKFERLTAQFPDAGLRRELPAAVRSLETITVADLTTLLGRIRA